VKGGNQPEIEEKNLIILEDQLKHEALAYRKCNVYAEYFQDPTLQDAVRELAWHHKTNFENLLEYLESHQ